MKIKSILACSAIFALSAANFAVAAPQTGTWLMANGQNAYGGEIINIDAQNNKLFVIFAVGEVPNNTYFLYGSGAINGDNVEVELTSSKDLSKRLVTGSFNTSTTGILNFPGVGARTIYRVKLDDESSPVSMMGLWNFNNISYSTGKGSAQVRLFNSVAPATVNGNGFAVDDTLKFGCEYQVKGDLQGLLLCADVTISSLPKVYAFKRSANEAGGIYSQDGVNTQLALAQRLDTSDGKTPLILKQGGDHQKILASAIQNFVNRHGAETSKLLLKKN
ncbi:hypothetical protein [Ottowia thiooxydans]|uniref:hypothetical protein n=1 Tax=Ottowia thiooxydans TaxID=219182 RepID=UPI0004912D52|nr:hypothetical protein [Ottowia thiooxydans]